VSVILSIVEQHVEEVAILWLRRARATHEPHYSLADLAKLEGHVEAHVDGLRIAGDSAWDVCCDELKWEEPGEIFAAGVLALESDRRDRIDKVLEVAASAPELERGFVSALGWIESAAVVKHLDAFIASKEPAVRRIGLAGFAVRRKDPGPLLVRLLSDGDPRVRARAIKAVAELGRRDLVPNVLQLVRDADDDCRFYAAWTAARLGQRYEPMIGTLVEFAERPGPRQIQALGMALRSLDAAAAKAWLRRLGPKAETLRVATIGIGILGDPELMSTLLQLMTNDEVARVAGESFSMITGIDLAYDDLERDRPEGFESGPTEDPADENVALDEDENLPWPDAELIAKWWSSHGSRFQPGRRYLCGREINVESARQVLVDGKQRQRAAAALELALLQPAEPLFEIRARGSWQQRWLGSAGGRPS
jgi:uncharacterized protein (TIGR02270 family)